MDLNILAGIIHLAVSDGSTEVSLSGVKSPWYMEADIFVLNR